MLAEFERIFKYYYPCEEIPTGSKIIGDLDLNSIEIIDMIMDIEKAYKIRINEVALRKIDTVQDLIDHIEKTVKKMEEQQ